MAVQEIDTFYDESTSNVAPLSEALSPVKLGGETNDVPVAKATKVPKVPKVPKAPKSRKKAVSALTDVEADESHQKNLDATQIYLSEIGFSPLLSAEEEVYFARKALKGDEALT